MTQISFFPSSSSPSSERHGLFVCYSSGQQIGGFVAKTCVDVNLVPVNLFIAQSVSHQYVTEGFFLF